MRGRGSSRNLKTRAPWGTVEPPDADRAGEIDLTPDRQGPPMGMRATSMADIKAFAELGRRRRQLLYETYGGCKLKIGKSDYAGGAKDVVSGVKDIASEIKTAASAAGKEAAESLLKKL